MLGTSSEHSQRRPWRQSVLIVCLVPLCIIQFLEMISSGDGVTIADDVMLELTAFAAVAVIRRDHAPISHLYLLFVALTLMPLHFLTYLYDEMHVQESDHTGPGYDPTLWKTLVRVSVAPTLKLFLELTEMYLHAVQQGMQKKVYLAVYMVAFGGGVIAVCWMD
jgi:hypothetical protein